MLISIALVMILVSFLYQRFMTGKDEEAEQEGRTSLTRKRPMINGYRLCDKTLDCNYNWSYNGNTVRIGRGEEQAEHQEARLRPFKRHDTYYLSEKSRFAGKESV